MNKNKVTIVNNNMKATCVHSYTLLNSLLKLFIINFHTYSTIDKGRFCLLLSVLKVSFISIIHIYCFYFQLKYVNGTLLVSVELADSLQTVYDYCQYVVDLYVVHKYGMLFSLEYCRQYVSLDATLGIPHWTDAKKRFKVVIKSFILLWLITLVTDFIAWTIGYGWLITIHYGTSYVFLFIRLLTVIDLIDQVTNVGSRLQAVADYVQQYFLWAEFAPDFIGDSINHKKWLCFEKVNDTDRNFKQAHRLEVVGRKDAKWLSRCYLLLLEQCAIINRVYGVRILLNSLSLFIDMVRYTNLAVRVLLGQQGAIYTTTCAPVVSSLMRTLTCAMMVIVLVEYCERVYRQRERIISLTDHILFNKSPPSDMGASMQELRLLVQTRPMEFHASFFFRLDYTLLMSIASVVVTYTIILLQSPI